MKFTYTVIQEVSSEEKEYIIKINTPLGAFEGSTKPDEIDRQYPSAYHASEIALAKALRKYIKAAIRTLKTEIKLLKNIIEQVNSSNRIRQSYNNTTFRTVYGTLRQKEKELASWETWQQALTSRLKKRIAARDKIISRSYKKMGESD